MNGLCSYGDKLLAAIVLSFLKVPLTIVPSGLLLSVALAFQDWISKVSRLQWAEGKRTSDRENEIKPFSIFALILAWTEAPPAVRGCCASCQPQWLLVKDSVSRAFLPHPGSSLWHRAPSSVVRRALPVPAAAGISQTLSLCLHQPARWSYS